MAHQLSMISQFVIEGSIQTGSRAKYNLEHFIDKDGSLATTTTLADSRPGLIAVPVTGHFGFHRFNSNLFLPVHFVGVAHGVEKVDGFSFDETLFTDHDFGHSNQIEEGRMNPRGNAIESTANQLEGRIEAQRYYLKVRETLASKARQRVLWEALWFYTFHEVGLKMDLQHVKDVYDGIVKLQGFLADRNFKSDFTTRIQN